MVKAWQTVIVLLGVWAVAQPFLSTPVEAQLNPLFYITTCPQVYPIVAKGVFTAIQEEARNAASLLRLHFHDCFVQGCDGSILLNGTATNTSEKIARPNLNSIRGYTIIDSIKASLESACPGIVSCADIVTLASFFSVVLSGGPIWWVPLGRRDSFFSNFNLTSQLPGPNSNISTLKQNFDFQNLTVPDLVSLSGGHTIGLSRCAVVTPRIFNFSNTPGLADPTLNTTLLNSLKQSCPFGGNGNVTVDMDIRTPTVFDNLYFKNLIVSKGLFQSDQALFNNATDTRALVLLYAADQNKFFQDFAAGMLRMGNLNVLTGTAGEIRKNCAVRNNVTESERSSSERTEAEDESETVRKPETVENTESAVEFFRHVVKQVVEEIMAEKLEKLLVEDTISEGHSSM